MLLPRSVMQFFIVDAMTLWKCLGKSRMNSAIGLYIQLSKVLVAELSTTSPLINQLYWHELNVESLSGRNVLAWPDMQSATWTSTKTNTPEKTGSLPCYPVGIMSDGTVKLFIHPGNTWIKSNLLVVRVFVKVLLHSSVSLLKDPCGS